MTNEASRLYSLQITVGMKKYGRENESLLKDREPCSQNHGIEILGLLVLPRVLIELEQKCC